MKALCSCMALTILVLATPAESQAGPLKTLVFTGALNDGAGKPVGGIYNIRFGLHQQINDPKTLWSEDLFVAVERGSYQVELGKERPIPQTLPLTSFFLSILVDGVEVQRLPVVDTMVSSGVKEPASQGATCAVCQEAAKAQNAEKLGGMTFAQLMETVAKRQVALGTSLHMTEPVGKKEGDIFFLTCPPGYVVTGIKGNANDSIRSAQLVCAPLENK